MIKLLKFHVFFAAIFLILILLPSLTSCQSKTDSYTTSSLSATTNKKDPLTTSSQATGDGTDTVEVSTNPIESITPITTGSSLYLNKTICIDPGHGFKDNGAESTFTDANGKTVLEKNITLAICNYLVAELQNKGYTVVLTRGEDGQTPNAGFSGENLCNITQRINWANEQGYCLYVSIHCNSYTNSSTQGARIYYNSGNNGSINKVLCQDIANELSKLNGKSPSVFNDADLAVATKTIMPAALIETGFITNKSDFQKLTDSSYQKEFAASIASAMDKFMQDHPFDPNEIYPYIDSSTVTTSGGVTTVLPQTTTAVTTEPSPLYFNQTICIDPGHGFRDNGAESTFTDANGKTVLEKNITLAICNYLVAELQNKGYTVVLTRGEDSQTPNAGFSDERLCNITQRINWANEQGYCLYVSIHCNSYTNSSTQGARIYYNSGNNGSINKVLCQDIANELSKLNGKSPSVFNDADLAVATKTIMPAALIETGFITNKSDFQKLTDSSYQKEFAASIASAIDQFMQDHPFDPNEVYPYL